MRERDTLMVDNLRFEQTCVACPEQYDVFDGQDQIGYVRVRNGRLTVESPFCGGSLLLSEAVDGDGMFEDYERAEWLQTIAVILMGASFSTEMS